MRPVICFLLLLLAACRPAAPSVSAPTIIPFPTTTPGAALIARLPPAVSDSALANPATAIALANQPTATPNYRACPAPNAAARLSGATPPSARAIEDGIAAFLNQGGTLVNLERGLRETWTLLGTDGLVRGDLDLSGEGIPEVVVTLETPDEGGILLIFGCVDSRYQPLYRGAPDAEPGQIPRLVRADDLNRDSLRELIFSAFRCATPGDDASCLYITAMAAWNRERGRFNNLLASPILSAGVPTIDDIDDDGVLELIVNLDNPGSAETGPLRTGYTIYDWNGVVYTQSITQLNPPRFRIQVIHQADAAFRAGNISEAISLYDLSLNSPSLEPWRGGDENTVLESYALYRLMLAFAFTQDARLIPTVQAVLTTYPDAATAPVYAALASSFWNTYQVTNNLNAACTAIREQIAARPEAVSLLNRYGSRSPTYTAEDVCPF
jgi:hypothetical protein